MAEYMKATGNKIICMDKGFISGLTEENTKEAIQMIKKKDMVSIPIRIEDATKDNGRMVNSMEKGCLLVLKAYLEKANGRMARDYIGQMKLIQNIRLDRLQVEKMTGIV